MEYGLDLDTEMYYVQPAGSEPLYFGEIHDPVLTTREILHYGDLLAAGRGPERIDLMIEQNAIEYYLGWYARQFE